MKLCKDQLIGKLVSLFKDAGTDIDEAVKEAKSKLTQEAKKARRGDLEKLFDSQIATLKDRGCPEQILEVLKNHKAKVLNHAELITIAEGNLAFAPVITPLYLGYHGIVSIVRHNGRSGYAYAYLDPRQITDEEKVPVGLYYQFDVEDGTKYLGKKPEVSNKLIQKEKRLRSTTAEIVSIGIHTDVLSKHYMDAVGSRFRSGRAPLLCLRGGRPRLDWRFFGVANVHWGAASCGSRLEL